MIEYDMDERKLDYTGGRADLTEEEVGARLQEMILFILNKCGPMTMDEIAGRLWLIDKECYLQTGKSMSGATYIKERCSLCPPE